MRHIGAFLLKFVVIAVVLELVLWNLTALSFGNILSIALTVSILAYLIGDLGILPRSNNTVATLADGALALVTILMFNLVFPIADTSFLDALIASVGIAAAEWLFHKFMSRTVLPTDR